MRSGPTRSTFLSVRGGKSLSRREDYESRTEELLLPILEKYGFDLWDVEYEKEGKDYYLRAYIDKEGGIMIDDCVTVSHELSDLLDEKDFIEDAYILEVSSPGLGRVLKKDKELTRCIGEDVEIRTYRLVNGTKDFTGELVSFDKESITIAGEEEMRFLRSDIAVIRRAIDF